MIVFSHLEREVLLVFVRTTMCARVSGLYVINFIAMCGRCSVMCGGRCSAVFFVVKTYPLSRGVRLASETSLSCVSCSRISWSILSSLLLSAYVFDVVWPGSFRAVFP